MSDRYHPTLYQASTTATTRILGWDSVSCAVGITQTVYPAARPNAVLLASPTCYPEVLAATRLMHHPYDAALLFTEGDGLEDTVSRELIRLSPRGNGLPGQVIVIGVMPARTLHDLADLGFKLWHVIGHDLWETIEFLNELEIGKKSGNALLVSSDPCAGGTVAGGYAAHTGAPILFASEQGLYPSTVRWLKKHPRTRVFVASPEAWLPARIAGEIKALGSKVEAWVGGADAYDMSVRFAKFRHKSRFGWGKRERSSSPVTLVPMEPWPVGTAASALSYRGKYTPLLLTKRDVLTTPVEDFLRGLHAREQTQGQQGHGFIVGGFELVSYPVQMRMHRALTEGGLDF
ncbi:hypothetical protein JJB07_13210 [Tumebacillus sp. ITR2]|uniref:Nitrogenase/oxidoreductase component 1 domain-containing protein n=1 Tax=Tumebacillus amylolyticus TaxID=2801339 RepID=A0ABS1JBD1_9BACL|nr:hypothetical protein [Tumebacillus amylolyticus]MBL0387592.1 hypothetical protein [Tumebacillus amylolyticus]